MKGFKEYRKMKVQEQSGYRYKSTPTIMLKGQWLRDIGFDEGPGTDEYYADTEREQVISVSVLLLKRKIEDEDYESQEDDQPGKCESQSFFSKSQIIESTVAAYDYVQDSAAVCLGIFQINIEFDFFTRIRSSQGYGMVHIAGTVSGEVFFWGIAVVFFAVYVYIEKQIVTADIQGFTRLYIGREILVYDQAVPGIL